MVRILYILILLLLPANVFAQAVPASFDAYIDRENVSMGATFQVKLELIGATPLSPPDLAIMPADINVTSQQQQTNVTYVNNIPSQDVSWILDVVAQKEGTYKIPAIEIKTNSGSLYTKPFRIFVKSADQISSSTNDNSVYIEVQADKLDPYIDEPVLYKTNVYYLGDMQDAELVKPKAENAIIEQVAEPKPSRQLLNGVNYKMLEISYLVTPVHTGDVEISAIKLYGKIAKNLAAAPQAQQMNSLLSQYDQDGTANATALHTPFTVASKAVKLAVKPAEAGVDPWLALYNLQIDDELGDVKNDAQNKRINAKIGEPFTRKVRLSALGKGGDALPDIENSFNSPDFKVYADRPENTREIIPGDGPISSRIKGTKTQTFTFIPQKTGMLNLPELNIKYWSLKDNKAAAAALPSRVITSLESDVPVAANAQTAATTANTNTPSPQVDQQVENAAPQTLEEKVQQKFEQVTNSPQAPNLIILLLSFIICVVIFVSFKIITTARNNPDKFDEDLIKPVMSFDDLETKRNRKIVDPKPNNHRVINFTNKGREPDKAPSFAKKLRAATSHKELQEILQRFANRYLDVSTNAGTVTIAMEISNKYHVDKVDAMKFAAELDSVLYAGKQIDLDYLKNSFADLISKAEGNFNLASDEDENGDKLISLNP